MVCGCPWMSAGRNTGASSLLIIQLSDGSWQCYVPRESIFFRRNSCRVCTSPMSEQSSSWCVSRKPLRASRPRKVDNPFLPKRVATARRPPSARHRHMVSTCASQKRSSYTVSAARMTSTGDCRNEGGSWLRITSPHSNRSACTAPKSAPLLADVRDAAAGAAAASCVATSSRARRLWLYWTVSCSAASAAGEASVAYTTAACCAAAANDGNAKPHPSSSTRSAFTSRTFASCRSQPASSFAEGQMYTLAGL
mmetsp:Transcript_13496/g.49093  ORF Transcript_13496/g.49093 Transcript_13496/m.49093 type:complete len:252 (+) Transcript_13496:3563-4318(+)